MTPAIDDPYRQYPLRVLGYTNALIRPWRESVPSGAYQASIGFMHTFFLTNSYDYIQSTDSRSSLSSAIDCYTWHCGASWVGPALVIDNTIRLVKRFTASKYVPIAAAYLAFAIASPFMDKAMNWYFYGFWNAGSKERPRLML